MKIRYEWEGDLVVAHLDSDGWSAGKLREFHREVKRLAALEGYPEVLVQVLPEKSRFMEHLGLTFVRNRWTPDGTIVRIYYLDTKVYKDA